MKYTRENIVDGINAKLDEIYGDNYLTQPLKRLYKKSLPDYPVEIEQNVLEWVNSLPFTEVDCHGESIKRVMDSMQLPKHLVPMVLQNFILFKESGFANNVIVYSGLFMEG